MPRSSSRGWSFGISPTARSNKRTNALNATSQSRRAASSRSRGCSPASVVASTAVRSMTSTIGSPSRSFRSAMTDVNHCQWSPTAT